MRVATVVLGISFLVAGGLSEASDRVQKPSSHRTAAVLADGVLASPSMSPLITPDALSPNALLYARDASVRRGLAGAMGFLPSQSPVSFLRPQSTFSEPRIPRANDRFNPASIALPATRSLEDHLLTGFVALMLIAYQLRRKHRFLRPHQFST